LWTLNLNSFEKWCVLIPFSIYLGWITVATVANVTAVLSYLRWNGWGIAPANWAVIMLLVSALVAGLVSRTRRDVAYVLVIVWAFTGIAVKHQATSIVAIPAAMLALILALSLIPVAPRRR